MDKFTFFDVEYANSKNKAICQMGVLCKPFDSSKTYDNELNIYVNPEDEFDEACVRVHGITKGRVKNEPSFAAIWPTIEKYFTNAIIVGHNVAGADLDALVKCLRRYNFDVPEFYYIDTYEIAKSCINRFEVDNYGLSCLCEYFELDEYNSHDAFADACANAKLFYTLIEKYAINPLTAVKKYEAHETREFSAYISSPELRKKVSEFYGILRGFSIDNEISEREANYLVEWKKENTKYADQREISEIIEEIEDILSDGVVTVEEIKDLQRIISQYLEIVESSPITLATQILDGIMKGITHDGMITEEECKNLRTWMYDNIYLSGHFPFNRLLDTLNKVLEDGYLTQEESLEVMSTIEELLNPIETTRKQILSVGGKRVCLSGEFKFGKKTDVEAELIRQGALVEPNVKKTTDILMVGDLECKSYSNGSYGTKVKKAIEYNGKGSNILIIKESDFFSE